MSWWKFPAQSAGGAPARAEIIADALAVDIHVHDVPSQHGPLTCWSYVSDGLAAHAQDEIVFTLRRDPGEPDDGCPDDPMRLLATLYELAAQGQRVTAGGITQFGEQRFFDHHLLYVAAQPLPGVVLPPRCLAALLITDDELRAVRTFGSARVLARMGQATSHYPHPTWSDRRRPGLVLDRTFEASVLATIPRMALPAAHVVSVGEQIVLAAPRGLASVWRDRLSQLPEGSALALLTALDPSANACLTWVPGQTGPEAIIPPGSDGSRVSGCFVVFVPGGALNGGQILEDGFAIELTGEAWAALRSALIDGGEFAIPQRDDRMAFALTWRDRAASAAGASPAKVALGPVRLVTPEAQFAERASRDDLRRFCRELQRCTERVLGDHDGQLELRLQVVCRPRSHRIGVSHRGELDEARLDALIDALELLPPMPVASEVTFEVDLVLAAGPRPGLLQ